MATVLDTLITRLGFQTDTTGLDKAEKGLSDLKTKALAIAGTIGTVLGGRFLINRIADAADETLKFADSIEVAVEEVSALDFAVQRQGGSIEGLRSSLVNMTAKLGEAARGTGEAKTAMDAYGMTLEKEDGTMKTTTDVLLDLNNAFMDLSRAEQLDLANKFGLDQGTIRLLQTAPDEVHRLLVEAKNLGVLTRQEAQRAAEFNDGLTNMAQALNKLGMEAGSFLFKPLTDLFNLIAQGTQYIREHSRFFKILGGILTTVAAGWALVKTQALAAQASMFAMPPLFISLIALVALLADDVAAYFKGQDSLLGDAVKKWPELEKAIQLVVDIWGWLNELTAEAFDYWGEKLPGIIDWFATLSTNIWGAADGIRQFIKDFQDLETLKENIKGTLLGDEEGGGFWQNIKAFYGFGNKGLEPAPSSAAMAGVPNNTNVNQSNTVTVENVTVDARGGDSQEIAQNITTALKTQLQNTVQDVDSQIYR